MNVLRNHMPSQKMADLDFSENFEDLKDINFKFFILNNGKKGDFILFIAQPKKGIKKIPFRRLRKGDKFFYRNGGQILFETMSEIIAYMIKKYTN